MAIRGQQARPTSGPNNEFIHQIRFYRHALDKRPHIPNNLQKGAREWHTYLSQLPHHPYRLPKDAGPIAYARVYLTDEDFNDIMGKKAFMDRLADRITGMSSVFCCCGGSVYLVLALSTPTALAIEQGRLNASQERATIQQPSAYPLHTRVTNVHATSMFADPRDKIVYDVVSILAASAKCRNMLSWEYSARCTAPVVDTIFTEDIVIDIAEARENEFVALSAREFMGDPKPFKDGVTVHMIATQRLDEEAERGNLPWAELMTAPEEQLGGIQVGPRIVEVTPSLAKSPNNEVAGLSRHWSPPKSKRTGDPLAPSCPEVEAIQDEFAQLAADILAHTLIRERLYADCLESIRLPTKWSAEVKEQMVEYMEQDAPMRAGAMQKLKEIALEVTKLPRMVVSYGTKVQARHCMYVSPVEYLLYTTFKHLGMKHMSLEDQDERIVGFMSNETWDAANMEWKPIYVVTRKGTVYRRVLLSTDNSMMDASVTARDRKRFRMAVETIIKHIRSDLSKRYRDPVLWLTEGDMPENMKWYGTFCTLVVKAVDAVEASGERATSIQNRWTKICNRGYCLYKELDENVTDAKEVFTLWILFDLDLEPECLAEDAPRRERVLNEFLRHGDRAYDIGVGDGDDDATKLLVKAADKMEYLVGVPPRDYHKVEQENWRAQQSYVINNEACYKIVEPAFPRPRSDVVEILSRYHYLRKDSPAKHTMGPYRNTWASQAPTRVTNHIPKPMRWLQRVLVTFLDITIPRGGFNGIVSVRGRDYAMLATALCERIAAAKELPVLRWLAHMLAKFYAVRAYHAGYERAIYDAETMRKDIFDGEFKLLLRVEDLHAELMQVDINYDLVVRTFKPEWDDAKVVEHAAYLSHADGVWSQCVMSKAMILDHRVFCDAAPLDRHVVSFYALENWISTADDIDKNKLAKAQTPHLTSAPDVPVPVTGGSSSSGVVRSPPTVVEPMRDAKAEPPKGDREGVAKPDAPKGTGSVQPKGKPTPPEAWRPKGTAKATSLVCIYGPDRRTVLICREERRRPGGAKTQVWGLPGGKVERAKNETFLEAAIRECKEELDIDIPPGDIVPVFTIFSEGWSTVIWAAVQSLEQYSAPAGQLDDNIIPLGGSKTRVSRTALFSLTAANTGTLFEGDAITPILIVMKKSGFFRTRIGQNVDDSAILQRTPIDCPTEMYELPPTTTSYDATGDKTPVDKTVCMAAAAGSGSQGSERSATGGGKTEMSHREPNPTRKSQVALVNESSPRKPDTSKAPCDSSTVAVSPATDPSGASAGLPTPNGLPLAVLARALHAREDPQEQEDDSDYRTPNALSPFAHKFQWRAEASEFRPNRDMSTYHQTTDAWVNALKGAVPPHVTAQVQQMVRTVDNKPILPAAYPHMFEHSGVSIEQWRRAPGVWNMNPMTMVLQGPEGQIHYARDVPDTVYEGTSVPVTATKIEDKAEILQHGRTVDMGWGPLGEDYDEEELAAAIEASLVQDEEEGPPLPPPAHGLDLHLVKEAHGEESTSEDWGHPAAAAADETEEESAVTAANTKEESAVTAASKKPEGIPPASASAAAAAEDKPKKKSYTEEAFRALQEAAKRDVEEHLRVHGTATAYGLRWVKRLHPDMYDGHKKKMDSAVNALMNAMVREKRAVLVPGEEMTTWRLPTAEEAEKWKKGNARW